MPEEQQTRNYSLAGYPTNIWGYSVDEQAVTAPAASAAPSLSGSSMWSRQPAQASPMASMAPGTASGLASRSASMASLSSAPSFSVPSVTATPANRVSSQSSTASSPNASTTSTMADDDLILTAIVVKNIPFAVKKEQLIEVMTQLGLPLPYAFNYHFDNGVFRGLAFANFSTPEETAVVISNLNNREIGGRKLRVEYKKMLPAQERERIEREKRERRGQLEEQHASRSNSPVASAAALSGQTQDASMAPLHRSPPSPSGPDFNDPETLEIYSSLLLFQAGSSRLELLLGPSLSPAQIHTIQTLCGQLQLQVTVHEALGLTVSKPALSRVDYPSAIFREAAASGGHGSGAVPQRTASSTDLHQTWNTSAGAGPAGSLFSEGRYSTTRFFAPQHNVPGVIGKQPEN